MITIKLSAITARDAYGFISMGFRNASELVDSGSRPRINTIRARKTPEIMLISEPVKVSKYEKPRDIFIELHCFKFFKLSQTYATVWNA
jgi:hypothetical protein